MSKQFSIISGILFLCITGLNAQMHPPSPGGIVNDFSQLQVLDKTVLSCQYRQSIVRDTLNDRRQQELMLLQIGDKVSKYFKMRDSKDHRKGPSEEAKIRIDSLTKAGRPPSQVEIHFGRDALFKNYPENRVTVVKGILAKYFRYEEDLLTPVWKLLKDTASINGYLCRKAVTSFLGRDYEAWYAPEIPVSDGPWKFRGLPGLIFKVEDSNRYFSFECISVGKDDPATDIYIDPTDAVPTSKKEFNRIDKAWHDDPKGVLGTLEPRIKINVETLPPVPYIPMELEGK